MVDSYIGYDYLLLIYNVHYFIMLLLYMAFDDSRGPTLTQRLMKRSVERDENYVCLVLLKSIGFLEKYRKLTLSFYFIIFLKSTCRSQGE